MGKKRKPTAKNGKPQQRPQKSFPDLVAEAAKNVVKPYVQQQIQNLGFHLKQENVESMRMLYTRLTTIEKLILKKHKISEDEFAELVADTEDESNGLKKVKGIIEKGDLVRLSISTKTKDQKEFQGSSRLVIEDVGNEPFTLGSEVEPQLLGLKVGEKTELSFGKDDKMLAEVIINRVSRRPKPKEAPKKEEPKKEESKKEAVNDSADAGT